MKRDFGKWLMDIAKYIATAVVLSSIFGGIERQWLLVALGATVVVITLAAGLYLARDKDK